MADDGWTVLQTQKGYFDVFDERGFIVRYDYSTLDFALEEVEANHSKDQLKQGVDVTVVYWNGLEELRTL